MNKARDNDLNKVLISLREIFEIFKGNGLQSIYLWGSILTNEYVPGKSDIDCIGIVENINQLKLREKINIKLLEYFPDKDIGIHLYSLVELNGVKPESRIAKVIPRKLFLRSFPESKKFKWVIGIKYKKEDFQEGAGLKESIEIQLQVLIDYYLNDFRDGDFTKFTSIGKRLLLIAHDIHQIELGKHDFSYSKIINNINLDTSTIVKTVLSLRTVNWNDDPAKYKTLFIETIQNWSRKWLN